MIFVRRSTFSSVPSKSFSLHSQFARTLFVCIICGRTVVHQSFAYSFCSLLLVPLPSIDHMLTLCSHVLIPLPLLLMIKAVHRLFAWSWSCEDDDDEWWRVFDNWSPAWLLSNGVVLCGNLACHPQLRPLLMLLLLLPLPLCLFWWMNWRQKQTTFRKVVTNTKTIT